MRSSFLFLCFIFLSVSCAEHNYPQTFPIVFTNPVTKITSAGATFSARVVSFGVDQKIVAYGFAWSYGTITGMVSTPVSGNFKDVEFAQVVTSDLKAGTTYQVKAFLQTDQSIFYGDPVAFNSLGSRAPILTSFTPRAAFDSSEVSIRGANFSGALTGNIVKIGGLMATVKSASDTLLKIVIPGSNLVGDYPFTIEVAGQVATSNSLFTILGPRITSISQLSAIPGDVIVLKGQYFKRFNNTSVFLSDTYITVNATIVSDSVITFSAPDIGATAITTNLGLSSGYKTFVFPQDFTLRPLFSEISPYPPFGLTGGLSCAAINEHFYVIGQNILYDYDVNSNQATRMPDFPGAPRKNGTAFIFKGSLFYGLGQSPGGGVTFNDFWAYDLNANAWRYAGVAPFAARANASCFSIDNKVYMGFGWGVDPVTSNNNFLNDFWELDPASMSWTQISTPITNPRGKYAGGGFSMNNNGYLVGIQDAGQNYADVWEFSPSQLSWSRKQNLSNLSAAMVGGPSTSDGTRGFVFDSYYNVYEYDQQNDTWIHRGKVATTDFGPIYGQSWPIAAMANGILLFGLGNPINYLWKGTL